jgi:hypothetical protein
VNNEKKRWVELGARGLNVPEEGLRKETFKYLQEGGKPSEALPITVVVYPEGVRRIVDGRHRIMLARTSGETYVHGVIWEMGARGGKRWSYTGKILI